jgi:hypothetical protein
MMKDAKIVLKDLDKATRDANKQNLAKYPTAKDYRDKVLAKQLSSVHAWQKYGGTFMKSMNESAMPLAPFPGAKESQIDQKATWGAIKDYQHYHGELTKGLAKLG